MAHSVRRRGCDGALRAILLASLALGGAAAAAERRAEFGVGLSALRYDDYPGSDQSHELLLPFPYIVVKFEHLDIDRDKVRSRFFDHGDLTLDVGFGGALPVDSSENQARSGMPDLAWVGEVGPELRYSLAGTRADTKLDLELVTRAAFSIGDPALRYRGWYASPRVSGERVWPFGTGKQLKLEGNLGIVYGSSAYHAYYYEVAPAFATPGRPAYEAPSGWAGVRAAIGFSIRERHFWYGGFVRYIDVSDAAYADSPLVRQPSSTNFGLAMAYVF